MSAIERYLDGTYATTHPSWHAEYSSWKAKQVMKSLARTGIQPHTVAEVGCGCGAILTHVSRLLPSAVFDGYDISPQATLLAEEQQVSGVTFHCEDFLQSDRTFDLVLLMDVVEHIEDCFTFLRSVHRSAKSVIVHFPLDMSAYGVLRGAPMSARRADGHLHYFSKDTALSTMEECGYDILDWFYTAKQEFSLGFKSSLSYLVRRSLYRIAPDFSVLALGCYGLLVAAQ